MCFILLIQGNIDVIGPVIGIDLGTTYSCVGVMKNNKLQIIQNDQGNRITPSYVEFNDEEILIGYPAMNQLATNPLNTVFDIKRYMMKYKLQTTYFVN